MDFIKGNSFSSFTRFNWVKALTVCSLPSSKRERQILDNSVVIRNTMASFAKSHHDFKCPCTTTSRLSRIMLPRGARWVPLDRSLFFLWLFLSVLCTNFTTSSEFLPHHENLYHLHRGCVCVWERKCLCVCVIVYVRAHGGGCIRVWIVAWVCMYVCGK